MQHHEHEQQQQQQKQQHPPQQLEESYHSSSQEFATIEQPVPIQGQLTSYCHAQELQSDHYAYQQAQEAPSATGALIQTDLMRQPQTQTVQSGYEFSTVATSINEAQQYQSQQAGEFEQSNLLCVPTFDCQINEGHKQAEYSSLERLSSSCEQQYADIQAQDAPMATSVQTGAQAKGARLLKGRRGRPRKKGLRSKSEYS